MEVLRTADSQESLNSFINEKNRRISTLQGSACFVQNHGFDALVFVSQILLRLPAEVLVR